MSYAILALLGLAILLQLLLWRAQHEGLKQLQELLQRLAALEKRLALAAPLPPQPAAAASAAAAVRQTAHADPLQQALGLARAGHSSQEIAARCGISEAEAELLVRMRGAPM